jgi:hypothetical protein
MTPQVARRLSDQDQMQRYRVPVPTFCFEASRAGESYVQFAPGRVESCYEDCGANNRRNSENHHR